MGTYTGFLVRDNFQDVGQIPTTGYTWICPDIIPYGQNGLTWSQLNSNYNGPDIGLPVDGSQATNIYVRAKNISSSPMSANVNLYYSSSSLLLYPTQWNKINYPNPAEPLVDQNNSTVVASNALAILQAAFLIGSIPPPPAGHHYCLIVVVNNNNIPVTIPSFNNNAEFMNWVMNNPNIAYRNIIYAPNAGKSVVSIQTFGNLNNSSIQAFFQMTGQNLGNVTYTLSCTDTRLGNPFQATGGFTLQPDGKTYMATVPLVVPANIGNQNSPMMAMSFTFKTNNNQPFTGTNLSVQYLQQQSSFEDEFETLMAQEMDLQVHPTQLQKYSVILLGCNVILINENQVSI